jgi:osmotically-inducible protein OsmY
MNPDARLLDDVVDELHWDPSVGHEEITVATRAGLVTLTGRVVTYPQKCAAERAVQRIHGVRAVANDLAVVLRTPPVGDEELARAAADAVRWSAEVPPASVHVVVEDGHVRLAGSVEWQYQRRAAVAAVARLAGVCGVECAIVVRPRAAAYDASRRIRAALRRYRGDGSAVDVEIDGGTITLLGTVRSWAERRDVEHAAWAARGVTRVDDRLVVVPR